MKTLENRAEKHCGVCDRHKKPRNLRKIKNHMSETQTALLAGGCFWGMQDLIRKQPGITATRVGYTGGSMENPKYDDVKTGETNHTEAIEIKFDPNITSYEDILAYFFQIHDPTTRDRQGNDRGTQYRSAIFYLDENQKNIAAETIKQLEQSGIWPGPIVTEVAPAGPFWPAEDVHQDYLLRNPYGYTCHFPRPEWKLPAKTDT